MIWLRNEDGKRFSTEKLGTKYIEICDDEGNLAAVVFNSTPGVISIIQEGDVEFHKYVKHYKVKTAKLLTVHKRGQ